MGGSCEETGKESSGAAHRLPPQLRGSRYLAAVVSEWRRHRALGVSSSLFMALRWMAGFLALCSVLMVVLFRSPGPAVTTVDVHAARELLGSGHRYLDVR